MPERQRIQWNAEQDAYDQALREGPTAALNHFSTLFSQRASVPLTSDRDELIILAEVVSEYFATSIDTNEELWRASIDSEFVLFLTNVVAEASFLDHHPSFGDYICRTLQAILRNWLADLFNASNDTHGDQYRVVPSDLLDAFWDASETMWTSLWNRRSTLAHRIDSFHWAPTFCALDMIAFLTDELRTVKFYPQRNYVPVMFQVAYFSWVYLHGSGWIAGRDMADMPSNHNAPLLVFDYLQVLRAYEDKSSETPHPSRAFMDDLVNAIDPHTLVRAADNALSHSESLVDDRLSAYINVLAIQMPLIGLQWYASLPAKALWDSLIRSSTMRTDDSLLGSWIDVYRCKTSMSAYAAVYLHFRTMISGIETGIIPLVSFSGYVFWNVLVCGLVVGHEAANLLRHAEGHCTCGDHEEFAEALSTYLGAISALVNFLTSEKQDGRLPRSFIDTMRDVATEPDQFQVAGLWYDMIETLRYFLRDDPSKTPYPIFLECWLKIADVFDIDEASQRGLKVARSARQCSWGPCVYHLKPSEKPLLVCKGCKEARYC